MLGLFIGNGYDIRGESWCSPGSGSASTLSEATRQCSADVSCTMFYDDSEDGTRFYLCDDDNTQIIPSTKGAILHIKRSEYIYASVQPYTT